MGDRRATQYLAAAILAFFLCGDAVAAESGASQDAGNAVATATDEGAETAELPPPPDAPAVKLRTEWPIVDAPERNQVLTDAVFLALVRDGTANVLYSPIGVDITLGLMAEASSDEIRAAIAEAAGATPKEIAATRDAFKSDVVTIGLGAGIWAADGVAFDRVVADRIAEEFGATIESVDFGAAETTGRINGWFAEKTFGEIPNLFDRLLPNTVLIGGTALYFNGSWLRAFDPKDTTEMDFHAFGGAQIVKASMMRRSARFAYARRDWGEVVELPFTDPRFVFVAALPRADAALIEAAVPATSELLQPLDSSLRAPVKGEVALPRLSMRDRRRLQSPLAAAGLQRVFTGGGAFDALLEPAPTLGAMVQASSFSMDEKGAVAASATAVIALRSLELSAFKMTFDRPFFFAILRRGVASPLMMGYVASLGG